MKRLAGTAIFLFSVALSFVVHSQDKSADPAPPAEKATPGELPLAIEMIGRFAQNYTLTFRERLNDAQFQLVRHPSANYRQTEFKAKLGEVTEDGKIKIEGYNQKEAVNALGIRVDASELTVTWLATGEKVILARQVQKTIPTYFTKLKADGWEDYIKVGDSFEVTSKPKTWFKLVKAEPEAAHVEWKDAEGKLRSAKIAKVAK